MTSTTPPESTLKPTLVAPAAPALLADRNFRWLISGAFLSALGDQFTLIALPWLVLQSTGDSLKLGLTLALIGVPRALLMLFGGALIDRYSAKTVIQACKYFNASLLVSFAILVYLGYSTFPVIAVFALLLGIATAFSIPAGPAIMPSVVAPERLPAANASMMFVRNLTMVAGPLLTSLLFWLASWHQQLGVAAQFGLSLAFIIDGLSYAVSIWTLEQVQFAARPANSLASPGLNPAMKKPVRTVSKLWHELLDGLRYCWQQQALRQFFLYMSAIAGFAIGPLQVVLPVLAQQLTNHGSVLGLLAASHGAGTLLGIICSSIWPRLRVGNLGKTVLVLDAAVAICFLQLAWIKQVQLILALLFVVGVLGGYVQVAIYTWMQRQVAPEFLGRAMSMFMFIIMGLAPLAAASAGVFLHYLSLNNLIVFGSASLLVTVMVAWRSRMVQLQDAC